MTRPRAAGPDGRPRRRPRPWRAAGPWLWRAGAAAGTIAAYFLLPLDHLGPRRPVLSWLLFVLALALVAALLLREIRNVLVERPDTRPGVLIPLLIIVSVHVFASAYYALAKQPGQFAGLRTRVDAWYFTVVTLATVGYGDITPRGQAARVLTVLQILYSFVFLTAAATALTQWVRRLLERRPEREPHE